MTHLFTVQAPDGTLEYVGPKGEVFTQHMALPWRGTVAEAEDELERRSVLWSARSDCHVREPQIITSL